MNDTVLIGAIRKMRKSQKKNQKEFARQIGWSYEKYMNFEKGKRVNLCDQDIRLICNELGLVITVSVKI